MSSMELADDAPSRSADISSPSNGTVKQEAVDVDAACVESIQNRNAVRPAMLCTSDRKMPMLSSCNNGSNKDSMASSDQPNASSSHVTCKGQSSVVSSPTTSAGMTLPKSVISNNDSSSSCAKASTTAASFSHALQGLKSTSDNGSPPDGCPSAESSDAGKELNLPKIRFSFPSMGSRLLPKAKGAAVSQQSTTTAQQPIGVTISSNSPRFVILKSGKAGASSQPISGGAVSPSVAKVSNQLPRPVMLSTASNDQRIILRGLDSKSHFISSAGLKRKLNDDQRKSVSNVYLMPASTTVPTRNYGFSPTIVTNKNNQNGKLLYISSTDAIVAFKDNTMKKRQLLNNRRPCNCTKSQCLKLYCDCFANGEFCSNCHCTNCLNNLANEVDRSKAIKSCLERNPMAFQPKIGKGKADTDRLHNKGCNCKKSSCLKNYCECYEARVSCTVRCKCFGCRNTEADRSSRNRGNLTGLGGSSSSSGRLHVYSTLIGDYPPLSPSSSTEDLNDSGEAKSLPKKFINDDVIEAMTRVMVATAEDLTNNGIEDDETVQIEIIKAFGSCLKKLVDTVSV